MNGKDLVEQAREWLLLQVDDRVMQHWEDEVDEFRATRGQMIAEALEDIPDDIRKLFGDVPNDVIEHLFVDGFTAMQCDTLSIWSEKMGVPGQHITALQDQFFPELIDAVSAKAFEEHPGVRKLFQQKTMN